MKLKENNMKQVIKSPALIAYCGLYCGACHKYLIEKCPGCHKNEKASWCKVRTCCIENNYQSCADCKVYSNVQKCKKYNNFMAKLFGLIFRSDRKACIDKIKKDGYEKFAQEMTEKKQMTIKK